MSIVANCPGISGTVGFLSPVPDWSQMTALALHVPEFLSDNLASYKSSSKI